jgi:hypothetical protein
MTAESPNTGQEQRHTDVAFEPRDINAGTIYRYLFALGLATAAALLISVYILRFTSDYAASTQAPPPPSREAHPRDMPPEPRLQGVPGHGTDPQQDLRNKLKADTEANEQFGWIDQTTGIAQIPVKDAMKIIAEKGLPAVTPPSAQKK